MEPMKSVELLELIFEYPEMYLGTKSVSALSQFLTGYCLALENMGVVDDIRINKRFSEWACGRFGYSPTHSWASICRFHARDDRHAFDVAKELWDEYKISLTKSASTTKSENP